MAFPNGASGQREYSIQNHDCQVLHLQGWCHPLPEWIVQDVKAEKLTVNQGKGFQFLLGTVVNPQGTVVSFL